MELLCSTGCAGDNQRPAARQRRRGDPLLPFHLISFSTGNNRGAQRVFPNFHVPSLAPFRTWVRTAMQPCPLSVAERDGSSGDAIWSADGALSELCFLCSINFWFPLPTLMIGRIWIFLCWSFCSLLILTWCCHLVFLMEFSLRFHQVGLGHLRCLGQPCISRPSSLPVQDSDGAG
jgi:hypothetical protein